MKATNVNNKGKEEKNAKVKEGQCIFPFKYKHITHNECVTTDKGDICATSVNDKGTLQTYGYCVQDSSPKPSSPKPSSKPSKTRSKSKSPPKRKTAKKVAKVKVTATKASPKAASLRPASPKSPSPRAASPKLERLNEKYSKILKKLEKLMLMQGDYFRSRAYARANDTIMGMTEDITDVKQLKGKSHIGEIIFKKLTEYTDTGKLNKLEREKGKPEYIFSEIFGVGPKKSKEIVEKFKITTMEELKKRKDEVLNDVQKKGIKYYEDIQKRIPRSEIDEYQTILASIFNDIKHKGSHFEIVGSYRRGTADSGDIDIIITDAQNNTDIFERFTTALHERGIIIDFLSKGKTKSLAMSKIPNHSPRRIDFMYSTPAEYAFAVLYFTGSASFNTVMRQRALNMGYTMNEHGIYHFKKNIKGDKIDIFFPDERSIFDFLGLEYKRPQDRRDGRDIVVRATVEENAFGTTVVTKKHKVVGPSSEGQASEGQASEGQASEGQASEDIPSEKEPKRKKNITLKNRMPKKDVSDQLEKFKTEGISVLEGKTEAELSKMIELANIKYYNDEPLLLDGQYDVLKDYIESKHPQNKAIKEVGAKIAKIEKNKVKLPYFMGSMDKIKPDTGAIYKWMEDHKGPYILSAKLDGVSALYVSKAGKNNLYTRGDGNIGQDITHLLEYLNLPDFGDAVIRGELIIPKEVFDKKYKTVAANARNLASGIVNQKKVEPEKYRDLDFVMYEVIEPSLIPSKQLEFLKDKSANADIVVYKIEKSISNESLSNILIAWREGYKYEIDGVIVTDDKKYRRRNANPEYAFAFKMVLSDQIAEAKVVDVLWTASKDGYLKPRIRIEPVVIGGATIEYATAFNAGFVEVNNLGIGSVVEMIRSGDVIPHIHKVITQSDKPKMPDVPYRWTETHVDIILEESAEDETVLLKQITYFFDVLDVDGMSAGNTQRMINAGFDTLPKIILMEKNDFLQVDGFKQKMATKVYESIKDKITNASLPKLMAATNLFGRGLGERKITLILDEYPNILKEKLTKQEHLERLLTIKGFARKTADVFVDHIDEFLEFLKMSSLTHKLDERKPSISKDHALYGKNIIFTGFRDKLLEAQIKAVGGKMVSSISKTTDYVIVKNLNEDTGKAGKAKELGIPMMLIDKFQDEFF
jgi:DNA ligase (NAD+)